MKKLILLTALTFASITGAASAQTSQLSGIEEKMVTDFHIYDEMCRGGIYTEDSTQKACGARDYIRHLMSASELCFEKRGDYESDGTPHRCEEGSVLYPDLPDFK